MGLEDPKHGANENATKGLHGSHTSFASAHNFATGQSCNEVQAECLSLGNQLAAIFGLYNGSAFISKHFREFLADRQIALRFSPPYTPQLNAQIESM